MITQLAEQIPTPVWIGEPPCRCGNDINLEEDVDVPGANGKLGITPDASGLALPRDDYPVLCTRAPHDAEVTAINERWGEIALLRIRAGQAHIMVHPYGQQFAIDAAMIDWEGDLPEAIYRIGHELNPTRHPGAAALQGFWGECRTFTATRVQPAKVLGTVSLVRLTTRAFARHGIFRYLGACYVLQEPDGLRFVTEKQMSIEFHALTLDNGQTLEF